MEMKTQNLGDESVDRETEQGHKLAREPFTLPWTTEERAEFALQPYKPLY